MVTVRVCIAANVELDDELYLKRLLNGVSEEKDIISFEELANMLVRGGSDIAATYRTLD